LGEVSVLSRLRFGVIPLLIGLSLSCSNPSEPPSLVGGVWVGRPIPPWGDSLRLVVVDSAGHLQGYGRVYPLITPDWIGVGTRTRSHLDLTLYRMSVSIVIRADLDLVGDRLRGTDSSESSAPSAIEFTRSNAVVTDLPGTWVLTRISDSTALPDNATTDTILLAGDGHLRRFVSRLSGCAATRAGFYRRQASLSILEYFDYGLPPGSDCGIPTTDTLTVVGATLVRRTVVGGTASVEETYERR
jgi:hypothetical protein